MGFFSSVRDAFAAITATGIRYTGEFAETGYLTMKNRDRLIEAICETYDKVWKGSHDYAPKDGVTYCNFAADDVAKAMGCSDFHGKLANEIVSFLEASPDWKLIQMADAQPLANQGSLVFAVARADPHGHICVIRPGLTEASGRWGKNAPACMNVGKDCFIGKSVNWTFRDMPSFYVWKKSL